jgi:O-succinylbenzoate-CoA ligase
MKNNVGLLLAKRAHLSPSLAAIVDVEKKRTYSFAELNVRSCRTANAISRLDIRKGDRVALLMMNGVEFIESFFAIAKIGAVIVPLNWRLVPDELSFILKDSGAKALIFGEEFGNAVADLQARGSEGSAVEQWIQSGGDTAGFAVDYDSLQAGASDSEPETRASDDDLLYIMYTSGTTGLPKGAVHTHATSIWALITISATADLRFKDRYLLALPLFHVGALTPLTGNIYKGATSIVMRSFDPVAAWKLIRDHEITTGLAVPAMLNFMLQAHQAAGGVEIPDQLRWIMCGAAPVPVTLIEAYADLGVEIHQIYGLTETCGPACLISPDDALAKAGSTGKAFFHTDVRVVNEAGKDVEPGEPGEVLVRGPHIMKEYWNRPEATDETIREGWLWTGDVATMDPEGFIYIQDRTKDMIISGGENVYPAEIENVLLGHPGIGEVAVIGQPSEKWGESPLAVVVKADPSLDAQSVLDHCQGKLARFKQPSAVEFIDEIPRNPTGKVLKRVLRERFPGPAPD